MCSVCIGAGDVGPVQNGTLFPVVDYFGQGKRVPFVKWTWTREAIWQRQREHAVKQKLVYYLFLSSKMYNLCERDECLWPVVRKVQGEYKLGKSNRTESRASSASVTDQSSEFSLAVYSERMMSPVNSCIGQMLFTENTSLALHGMEDWIQSRTFCTIRLQKFSSNWTDWTTVQLGNGFKS